jgi:hypothetical protein
MTPKEQYEARKAERKKQAESWKNTYEDREKRDRLTQDALLDTMDRFVTAVERIADALERPQLPPLSISNPNQFGLATTSGK